MRLMAISDDLRFQCYLMDSTEDAEALAHTYWLRERTRYPELSHKIQESCNEEAEIVLMRSKERHFVLWDAKRKRVVGKTTIKPPIEFTDSFITEDMQKRGLADLLYEARLKYMQESSYFPLIFAKIVHDNKSSIKAATRNGFQKSWLFRDFKSAYYFRLVPKGQNDPHLEESRDAVFKDPQARPHSLDR